MVQEAEVLCLTTADAKFSLPVGVNHLSKGLTAAETLEIIKKEMKQINVCLNHLKLRLVDLENGVLKIVKSALAAALVAFVHKLCVMIALLRVIRCLSRL